MMTHRLTFLLIALTIACVYAAGCRTTPTPTPQPTVEVTISTFDNQTQMVVGDETTYKIEINPPSLEGYVAAVNVYGDKGIKCTESAIDMWTWYCVAPQEAENAIVIAEVSGTSFAVSDTYPVKIVIPTPTTVPTATPTEEPTKAPTEEPTEEPTEPPIADTPTPTDVVNAILVDQPPRIDGSLDEEVWSQAQPLTYAVHPPVNDSTTMTVRMLWDDKYLYAGFDVSDTQVEDSSNDNVWDGDSVGVIIENGRQVVEYRYTVLGDTVERGRLIGDRASNKATSEARADEATSEASFKGVTTLNDPSNQDEGYTVEMRIPWATSVAAGDTIAADLWSIDHDQNPGESYDHRDTVFSKISWDGDQDVTTARKSILLSAMPSPTAEPTKECAFPRPVRPKISGTTDYSGEVKITTPEDCTTDLQPGTGTATGTYSEDLEGRGIWILFYASDRKYYPQSPNACEALPAIAADGRWETGVSFWGTGERFDIVATVTDVDSEASQEFKNWLKIGCETGEFPGFSKLPDGLVEMDFVTVQIAEPTATPTEEPTPEPSVCPFDDTPLRIPIEGPSVNVEVSITSMLNCTENLPRAAPIPLSGTISRDLTDKEELWILVYASDLQYYPQSANACLNNATLTADGKWQEVIRLGRPEASEAFHVVAVVTDVGSPASEAFHNYLTNGCEGTWGSVSLIPPGATELDSIVVHTK